MDSQITPSTFVGTSGAKHVEILTREMAQVNTDALLALSNDMPWETWTAENLLRELPEKWQRSRVVYEGNVPIAYAIISRKPHSMHVHHLIVGPKHRGLKIGDLLVSDAIQQARETNLPLTLKVHDSNAGAIEFYHRHGFAPSERQANGYINMMRSTELNR